MLEFSWLDFESKWYSNRLQTNLLPRLRLQIRLVLFVTNARGTSTVPIASRKTRNAEIVRRTRAIAQPQSIARDGNHMERIDHVAHHNNVGHRRAFSVGIAGTGETESADLLDAAVLCDAIPGVTDGFLGLLPA
jgi:hypothetical protein